MFFVRKDNTTIRYEGIFLVREYIKNLVLIKDFSTLKRGDRIFNRCSNSIDSVCFFHHVERHNGVLMVVYVNENRQLCIGEAEGFWYYL